MIILDFDGVLFDDARFKKDVWRVFRRFGIPHHVHQSAYAETKARYGGYRHDAHLRLIKRRLPAVDIVRVNRALGALLARSSRYLYHDALPFLTALRQKGEILALASNGYAFQRHKFRASGIGGFFKNVVIRDRPKSEAIKALKRRFRNEHVVFLDDKKSVVEEVKRHVPYAAVIQVLRRRSQQRSARADAVVSNLAAARRVIEQKLPRM